MANIRALSGRSLNSRDRQKVHSSREVSGGGKRHSEAGEVGG